MNIVLSSNARFYMFDLARQLHARGLLHSINVSYPRFKLRDEQLPQEKIKTFPYVHAPYMAWGRRDRLGVTLLRQWEWIAKLALDRHVARHLPDDMDLFVAISGNGLWSGRAARARGVPYVCDRPAIHIREQDTVLRNEYDKWSLPFPGVDPRVIEREESEYAEADAVVVPSGFAQRSFAAQGFDMRKVHCLPLGVDLGRFTPSGQPDPERFDVLFVAGMHLPKGVPYLHQAYGAVQHPKKSLTFVGSPSHKLIEHLRKIGVWNEEARVLGHVPHAELKNLMSRSHVLVLPSVQEGLAAVQAEAMACGCPVIGTTNSGAEHLFESGVQGWIIEAGSTDALTDRLQWMADHPAERAEMGRLALQRVQSMGGWRDYGEGAVALYRRLLQDRTRAAGPAPAEALA